MSSKLQLSWQTIYIAPELSFGRTPLKQYFTAAENRGYYQGISIRDRSLFHPVMLRPTDFFHKTIRGILNSDYARVIPQKNYPYEIELSECGLLRVGCVFHFFLPNILSIRTNVYNPVPFNRSNAFQLRQLDKNPVINTISGSRVLGGWKKFETRPIMELIYARDEGNFIEREKIFASSLLINDVHFKNSSSEITDSVLSKNKEHNAKNSSSRAVLIDKQGLLAVRDEDSLKDVVIEQEIRKKKNLFELGMALKAFYHIYPAARASAERRMDYLFLAAASFIQKPELTFNLSYSNTLAWKLIVREMALNDAFRDATRMNLSEPGAIRRYHDRNPEPNYLDCELWSAIDKAV